MKEQISVIIPVYNVEKYLEECIQSVIEQTYKNLEIILIDDGSEDGSGRICDEYAKRDSRIKVIHKENLGVSIARNTGLEVVNGHYISFIDGDDYINKDYFEKLLKKIKEEDVQCVICGFNRIYNGTSEIVTYKENTIYSKEKFLEKILNVQGGIGTACGKLWEKEAINSIRFNENIKIAEDSLFAIKAIKNVNNVYVMDEALYNYRFNKDSAVRKYKEDFVEMCLDSMKAAKEYIEEEYKTNEKIVKRFYNYISYHILLIVVNYCFNDENNLNFIKQIKCLKEVCKIPEFKEAIKESDYNGFSLTRKITLFTIKYKLYFVTMIIGKIRQSQFKR